MRFFRSSLQNHTDEELMQKAAAGNSHAFEIIYERYSAKLLGYFHRMLWKDRELAEDCLHKLFLKLIEKPELFNAQYSFKTWIYSIAHNMCKNEYRRMEKINGDNIQQKVAADAAEKPLGDLALDNKKFIAALDKELGQLGENHRQTFELRYFEHNSIKEIAQIMQCSEGTVKSRLFYTLKALAKNLGAYKNLLSH